MQRIQDFMTNGGGTFEMRRSPREYFVVLSGVVDPRSGRMLAPSPSGTGETLESAITNMFEARNNALTVLYTYLSTKNMAPGRE